MLLSLLRDGSLGRSAAKDGGPLAEVGMLGKLTFAVPLTTILDTSLRLLDYEILVMSMSNFP